ncbi:MAG: hypothetical protein QXD03_04840, partial [Candidatus Anstonellales archaeon]
PGATVLPADDPYIGGIINLSPSSLAYSRIQIRNNKGILEVKNPTGKSSIMLDRIILGTYRLEYDQATNKLNLYKDDILIHEF